MADELDPNVVVAQFIQQNLESISDIAKGIIKAGTNKVNLHLSSTYSKYLTTVLDKYSKVKSFLLRGEPVSLNNIYVPLHVVLNKQTVKSPSLGELAEISSHLILTGSAGSGKSMMMRHILLNSIIEKKKVPIFIELRQFNTIDLDLIALIIQVLNLNKFDLGSDYIDKALRAGHFVLLLDGYDEVDHSKRNVVRKNIIDLTKLYEKNTIIMTSRPDRELDGWQEYTVVQIDVLSLDQASDLIEKVPYDEDLKKKFLDDLKSNLFKKHTSFLSNPLLLSIMLLTYGQSANIPNKLNVFYNQAYEALFERHDALKGGYKRDRLTTLDIQDFGRIFSAFCLQAYDKRQFEFTKIQALEYIEKSTLISGITCIKEDFLKDLIQAVCLLVEEGLVYVYSHRSFQEYFTARFIADSPRDIQKKLINKYSKMSNTDSVLPLLYEIRPEIVVSHYLIPSLDKLFNAIGANENIDLNNYIKFMKLIFQAIIPHDKSCAFYLRSPNYNYYLISFIVENCLNLIGCRKEAYYKSNIEETDSIQKLLAKHSELASEHEISLSNYANSDELLRELGKKKIFYNLEFLRDLNKIRVALKQKVADEKMSLATILKRTNK